MKKSLSFLIFLLLSCSEEEKSLQVESLAQDSLIIDTHIDVPYRLWRQHEKGQNIEDISKLSSGNFDYMRAMAGGLNIAFFSIYLPSVTEELKTSFEMANQLIDMVEDIVSLNPNKFYLIRSSQDANSLPKESIVGIALGMENGAPIQGDLKRVKLFHDRGIRYITLTHSKSNHISDSSYDDNIQWGGLSDFGKSLLVEMNNRGMMIDVSHVNDQAFYQAIEISETPVIASHSSLRHFTPGFERNISDDMLLKLAQKGGVIQINFGSDFLTLASQEFRNNKKEFILSFQTERSLSSEEILNLDKKFKINNPYPFADISVVLDHIDRVVDLVGIDHVGIGSDFDGVGDTLPVGLKDVSMYPNLVQGLVDRGYSKLDIQKILGKKLLRVWIEVENYAKEH